MEHRDTSSSAYGDRGDYVYSFVGVSGKPFERMNDGLVLTSNNKFPYIARCTVKYIDGSIDFLDSILPNQ